MTNPAIMQKRTLGKNKLEVSGIGLGTMTMPDNQQSVDTIQGALDQGMTFFDTADIYGNEGFQQHRFGDNEKFLGRALRGRRDEAVIATKFGSTHTQGNKGDAAYIKKSVDASLYSLGIDHIDLYYQHRPDPSTPIEETIHTLSQLVKEGKIKHIGLSEASADIIRRADAIHPITAVQTEYSLWSRDVEKDILPTLSELGIGFVPYSPLGRGFLTGKIKTREDLSKSYPHEMFTRFQGENFDKNVRAVTLIREFAKSKNCTTAQLALAWLLAQGEQIVPIPGTKRLERVKENLGSLSVTLTKEDLAQMERLAPKDIASGSRF